MLCLVFHMTLLMPSKKQLMKWQVSIPCTQQMSWHFLTGGEIRYKVSYCIASMQLIDQEVWGDKGPQWHIRDQMAEAPKVCPMFERPQKFNWQVQLNHSHDHVSFTQNCLFILPSHNLHVTADILGQSHWWIMLGHWRPICVIEKNWPAY